MKLKILTLGILLLFVLQAKSQNKKQASPLQPKLIVGIVVDQMSYDFLYRYWGNYAPDGLKKLVEKGFSCENTNFNYVPTYTGPGHASIYTGSIPAIHGIVSNDWYNKYTGKFVYCTADTTVTGAGTTTAAGNMSPQNLLTTTICDELKLFNNMHSKVIGVALKDRGAILPAGHLADAAYWYDGFTNTWVSSTYYMPELPEWVKNYNTKKPAFAYLKQDWNLLLPPSAYRNSTADNVSWEKKSSNETASVFPHKITNDSISEGIKATPFGNSFTADFAKEAILHEQLGIDEYTDFLCISFSSTDYVGHGYGNYSVEIEDTYLRFDRDLASLMHFLNKNIGEKNYLLFVTADHGVAPTPLYAEEINIPAGEFFETPFQTLMESLLDSVLGNNAWIKTYSNQNIYLNDSLLAAKQKTPDDILQVLRPWLLQQDGIANVFCIQSLSSAVLPETYKQMFINGLYAKRSGDIFIEYEPNWADMYVATGTTHGSHYAYDTHVPLLWYGWGIKKGSTNNRVQIPDIAATLAALLHIREPSGCIGSPIIELKK